MKKKGLKFYTQQRIDSLEKWGLNPSETHKQKLRKSDTQDKMELTFGIILHKLLWKVFHCSEGLESAIEYKIQAIGQMELDLSATQIQKLCEAPNKDKLEGVYHRILHDLLWV